MKKNNHLQAGSTLIEILISVVVVGMVLTAVASALAMSVKNQAESKFRSMAASEVNKAMEVFRREKTLLGWSSFETDLSSGTYCLATLPSPTSGFSAVSGACGVGNTIAISNITAIREAVVTETGSPVDTIRVDITVSWEVNGRPRSVHAVQELKEWE